MAYKTQPGTIPHRVLQYLQSKPEGFEISSAELAEELGIDPVGIVQCLASPRKHGTLAVRTPPENRRVLLWSVGDGVPEEQAHDFEPDTPLRAAPEWTRPPKPAKPRTQEFRAAYWTDGSLIMVGVQVDDEGTLVLPPAQTLKLRQLLAWAPAP